MKKNTFFKPLLAGTLCISLTLSGVCQTVNAASYQELSDAVQPDNLSLEDDTENTSDENTEAADNAGGSMDDSTSDDSQVALDQTIVTLGADLDDSQKATVLKLLGLTEDDLDDCIVLEITNEDEHHYLDDYLSSDVIGKRALSSIRLDKADEGNGITVTTNNINYCTESMYVNALATAGLEDANVIVAGPFNISGTAALVGTIKAYEELTGEDVSEEVIDAATDELVTTGELSTSLGDAELATQFIGFVKNEVIAKDVSKEEDIRDIVEDAAKEMDINLTDEEVDQVVSTMKKISKLDIDIDSLKKQAQGLYDKLKDLDINFDSEKAQGFFDKVANFFVSIYEKIKSLFH